MSDKLTQTHEGRRTKLLLFPAPRGEDWQRPRAGDGGLLLRSLGGGLGRAGAGGLRIGILSFSFGGESQRGALTPLKSPRVSSLNC